MIKHLHLMRPAIDHFLAIPVNKDLVSHHLSDVESGVFQDFEAVLAVSPLITFYTCYQLTNKPFLGSSYCPTSYVSGEDARACWEH